MKIYLDNNLGVANVEQEELTQDTIGYNILKVYIPNAVLTPYDTFTCYYGALLQNGRKVGWFAMEARTSSDADYEANYTLYKATLEQCVVSVEGKVYIGCQVLLGNSGNATLIKKNTAVVQFNVRKSVAINNDILVLDTDQTTTDVLESYKNLLENALTTYATKASVYTKAQVDALLLQKADKSTTYTKTQVDSALALKADKSDTYTKTETNTLLNGKVNTSDFDTLDGRVDDIEDDISTLKSVQNVVEVVATKSALNSYDTTKLDANDKVQVIADETHDGASTIYNWSGSAWQYVGAFGGNSYTKQESDNKFAPKATALTHTGNQLQDYSGNNIYPNINLSKIIIDNGLKNLATFSGLHANVSQSNSKYVVTSNNDGGTPRIVFKMANALISGHKYYFKLVVKPTNVLPTKIAVQTMFAYSNLLVKTTDISLNKESILSGEYTSNNSDINISVLCEYSSSLNSSFEVYDIHLIDLNNYQNVSVDVIKEIVDNDDYIDGYGLIDLINSKDNLIVLNEIRDSKFKMYTFNSANRRLIICSSFDGINWFNYLTNVHTPTPNTCLRDPAVLYKDGKYHLIYSRILNDTPYSQNYDTGKYIGYATSNDGINWEEQTPIECTGYSNMWAPEWYKKSDGTYAIVLSCQNDGTEVTSAYYLPITSFEPFSYGVLQPLSLDGTPTYMIDLDIKSFKGVNYLCYTAGNKLRFAKEIDGVFISYSTNADWYNYNIEGGYMVEMNGKMRLYMAYHQNANSIYYSESTDMINWSSAKPCNLQLEALQHCSVLYDDEWIAKKLNLL